METRKISLCIPTWNRVTMTIQAFAQVYDDERISEIVICDDCSDEGVYEQLKIMTDKFPKVKLFRNEVNIDCYQNKRQVVGLASNKWVIVFDSDNVLDKTYLDRIFEIQKWDEKTVYCPEFAQPNFDYHAFAGLTIDRHNVAQYTDKGMFLTALNTFNFFINVDHYREVWDGKIDPVTSDSIYFNYCWLKSGRKIYFVPGLVYFHRVHQESHYKKNNHRTGAFAAEVEQKIKQLT